MLTPVVAQVPESGVFSPAALRTCIRANFAASKTAPLEQQGQLLDQVTCICTCLQNIFVTDQALPFKAKLVCKICFRYICNSHDYSHSVTDFQCCAGVWCPQNTIRTDAHARLQQRQRHRWHQNQCHICIRWRKISIIDWLCTCMLLRMGIMNNFARCTNQSSLQRC